MTIIFECRPVQCASPKLRGLGSRADAHRLDTHPLGLRTRALAVTEAAVAAERPL
jgi:hypothetical protein